MTGHVLHPEAIRSGYIIRYSNPTGIFACFGFGRISYNEYLVITGDGLLIFYSNPKSNEILFQYNLKDNNSKFKSNNTSISFNNINSELGNLLISSAEISKEIQIPDIQLWVSCIKSVRI